VLDIYGSLFFAAAPKIRESLPAVGEAHCPVAVLRLRGRGKLHSATIAMLRDYAAECAACGGRLYLAGVGPEMEEQLQRTGVLELLGPDAVVGATDELYGACATAQQRGRTWLAEHADGRKPGPRAV
jgi:SulP family sulfate permease